jgi:hypothetical protein
MLALQGVSQAPQWFTSLSKSTQAAPQALRPVVQPALVQTPRSHTSPAPQATPHAPQFAASAARFTQVPAHSI